MDDSELDDFTGVFGDMVFSAEQIDTLLQENKRRQKRKLANTNVFSLWENGIIPYTYDEIGNHSRWNMTP